MATPHPSASAPGRHGNHESREQQAVATRLLSLLEADRHRIARELHDQIGQAVTAMKLSAHLALDEDDAAQRRDDLQAIIHMADDTIERLRGISARLRPPQLDALGLEAALRWQVEQLAQTSSTQLELQIAPLAQRAGSEVELACFRIAQDTLVHACEAGARRIELSLRGDDVHLRLRIDSDDRGFDDGDVVVAVMHQRARDVGGELQFDADSGAGTHLRLRLPCQATPETADA